MPAPAEHCPPDLGNMTTVQLASRKRKAFATSLLDAAGDAMSLSELPLQDAAGSVYIIPKPLEDRVRAAKSWRKDADWEAGLKNLGAQAVNILRTEVVFKLIEMGRISAAGAPLKPSRAPRLKPVPGDAKGPQLKTLRRSFQGPLDWHLQGCNIPQAWAMFSQSADRQNELPWKDIRVGHIDTGYSEHVALAWQGGSSRTVDTALGYDFFGHQADARDPFLSGGNPGHGARTSATIGGFYPGAAGSPFYGAAPGVTIIPYRVTDSVIIDHVTRLVAQAIEDAVRKKCAVISISLGALFGDNKLVDALDEAYEQGVIVVCAAGNYWGEVIYPGRYNRCVTMGAIAPGMKLWGASAHGPYVDLCAPAQQVRRLKPQKLAPGTAATDLFAPPDGNGTSYATALGAGVAALWLAWHGLAKLKVLYPEPWMRVAAFKQLLRKTACRPSKTEVPQGWDRKQYGSGIIDAKALLSASLPLAKALVPALRANAVFDSND